MPPRIDPDAKGQIAMYAALDYTKQEIADEMGVHRNTVSKHLEAIRDEASNGDAPAVALKWVARGATSLLDGPED